MATTTPTADLGTKLLNDVVKELNAGYRGHTLHWAASIAQEIQDEVWPLPHSREDLRVILPIQNRDLYLSGVTTEDILTEVRKYAFVRSAKSYSHSVVQDKDGTVMYDAGMADAWLLEVICKPFADTLFQ